MTIALPSYLPRVNADKHGLAADLVGPKLVAGVGRGPAPKRAESPDQLFMSRLVTSLDIEQGH